ncbi:MAG: hypothetical protein KC482_09365, partial [Dehalococcoidia bacterium]|nr:hypothetical protein [Dehalococcoidia bacterium]
MKYPFELQESESVIRLCRRHWMYLYPRIALQIFVGVLPVAILTTLVGVGPGLRSGAGLGVLVLDVLWAAYWAVRIYFTI